MKIYEVEQSKNELQKMYSQLIDKLTEHVKILSLNGRPITTVMAIKRGLIRLKIGYLEHGAASMEQGGENKEIKLTQEEEILVTEIMEYLGIDVKQAVDSDLIGIKEMKRRLIQYHYDKMAKNGTSYKKIKEELSKKYGYSISAIEKLIYRKKVKS